MIARAARAEAQTESPRATVTDCTGAVEVGAGSMAHPPMAEEVLNRGEPLTTRAGGTVGISIATGHVSVEPDTSLVLFTPRAPAAGATTAASDASHLSRGTVRVAIPPGTPGTIGPFIAFSTPSCVVVLAPGDEATLMVNAARVTHVSVHSGRVIVRVGPTEHRVGAGSGLRSEPRRRAVVRPLPRVLAWRRAPPPSILSAGPPASFSVEIAPPRATPPTLWVVQVARDPSFRDLVTETRIPIARASVASPPLSAGTYHVRARGLDADGFEGAYTATTVVTVGVPRRLPGGRGQRAAIELPPGFYCGVDGAPLSGGTTTWLLPPGRPHHVRCATSLEGAGAIEFPVSAAESGPIVSLVRVEPPLFDAGGGTRTVIIELHDGAGFPIPYASIEAVVSPGAGMEPVREADRRGSYTATLHWRRGVPGVRMRFRVNGSAAFEYSIGRPSDGASELAADPRDPVAQPSP